MAAKASSGPDSAARREPSRESESIPIVLYKRDREQEKLLAETREREKKTRELLLKAKERYQEAAAKIGQFFPKKTAILEQLQRKEAKLREMQARIEAVARYQTNCKLFMQRGNVFEKQVHDTKDKIIEIIRKEYENEQKLVIVFRRKDYLERMISRKTEKHITLRAKFDEMLKQQHDTVKMHNEIRGNIQESISKAKAAYEKCIELAPKILERQKKVRLLEAGVYGLEMRINAKEDQLKKTKKDIEFMKQESERTKVEAMVRLERKMRKLKH